MFWGGAHWESTHGVNTFPIRKGSPILVNDIRENYDTWEVPKHGYKATDSQGGVDHFSLIDQGDWNGDILTESRKTDTISPRKGAGSGRGNRKNKWTDTGGHQILLENSQKQSMLGTRACPGQKTSPLMFTEHQLCVLSSDPHSSPGRKAPWFPFTSEGTGT